MYKKQIGKIGMTALLAAVLAVSSGGYAAAEEEVIYEVNADGGSVSAELNDVTVGEADKYTVYSTNVGGNSSAIISAMGEDGEPVDVNAVTVRANPSGTNGGTAEVSIGSISSDKGGLAVQAGVREGSTTKFDGTADVTVSGDIEAAGAEANAISVWNNMQKEVSVDVSGNVAATGEDALAVRALNDGDGSKTAISVGGNISAEGENGCGVRSQNSHWSEKKDSNVQIDVGGNITADMAGAAVLNLSGKTVLNIGGDVEAGTGIAIGLSTTPDMSAAYWGESPDESVYEYLPSEVQITCGGDVDGEKDAGIVIFSEYNKPDQKVLDVISAEVYVEGTVTGKEAGIVLDQKLKNADMNITVWKITGDTIAACWDGKYEVDTEDNYKPVYTEDEDFAKSINYIIKIEQPSTGGKLSVANKDGSALSTVKNYAGTEEYSVSKEGDIYLLITADDGYEVKAAYNGLGEKVELTKVEDGKYLVNVARGGGVYLTVDMQKIEKKEETPEENKEPETPVVPDVPAAANITEVLAPETTETPATAEATPTAAVVLTAVTVPAVSEPMATLTYADGTKTQVPVSSLIISVEELLAQLASDAEAVAAVNAFVAQEEAREDAEILRMAAVNPQVFGDAEKAVVPLTYAGTDAGTIVTFTFADGTTETAMTAAGGALTAEFTQAGAFSASQGK